MKQAFYPLNKQNIARAWQQVLVRNFPFGTWLSNLQV